MYVLKLFLLICLFTFKTSDAQLNKRQSFLGPCCIDDEDNFSSCYAANLKSILSGKFGSSLDPLFIRQAEMLNAKTENQEMSMRWTNIIVNGINAAIFENARLLAKTGCSTQIRILVPKIVFRSDYKILNGTLFSIPITSEGKVTIEIDELLVEMYIQCKNIRYRDGCTFANVEAVKLKYTDIKFYYLDWDITSGGDPGCEAQAQAIVMENWREGWELVRPTFERIMETILFDRFKKFFKYVPFSCSDADKPYWD